MSNNVIQTSFSAGELTPALYARVDLAKYHVGAALLENFLVDYRGGVFNRPGFEFVGECKSSDKPVRLIPFQFSTIQNYELEFGDKYMRVIKNGGYVLEDPTSITGITRANIGHVSFASNPYVDGDWLFLDNIAGMTELNEKTVVVSNATGDGFDLLDTAGNPINTTNFTAWTSGGTAARVYTLATPYAAEDLALLKKTQSADVMTLTHPSYAIYELNRLGDDNWTITPIAIGTGFSAPTNPAAVASSAGAAVYAYVITVTKNGQESIASARADLGSAVNIAATTGFISVSWDLISDADYYSVYKAGYLNAAGTIPAGAAFGWVGDVTSNAFRDNNITPDFTKTPPLAENPFANSNNPAAVGYFQQRLCFGGSTSNPETMYMSQPGAFHNFDVSNPIKDDDAIVATLASRQVNAIKFMIAMPGGLIVLTSGGAWQVSGGTQKSAVTPSTIEANPQAYNGCSDVEPIVINNDILYIQQKGSVVRDLSYNFYVNIYTGPDISKLAAHLFQGFNVKEWAYAEEPYKIVFTVRDDGALLSLTFLKEEEVIGWTHNKTLGQFKSVSSIQEGAEDAVYVVVRRFINGRFVQFVERMKSRLMPYGVEDAFFIDSGLTSQLTNPAGTLSASAASGNDVVFTNTDPIFTSDDVGKVLRMGGGIATITQCLGPTQLKGNLTRDIQDVIMPMDAAYSVAPAPIPLDALQGTWSLDTPTDTFSGLDHLEGQIVSILADGGVQPQQVVTNGQITIPIMATKISAGLPYVSDLQTLKLDTGEPTIQGKRKKIAALTTRVYQTRGLMMGPDFDSLDEFKMRNTQPMGEPVEPETGDQRIIMTPTWTEEGQICIRQKYPLPATVLGVIPEVVIGDTK